MPAAAPHGESGRLEFLLSAERSSQLRSRCRSTAAGEGRDSRAEGTSSSRRRSPSPATSSRTITNAAGKPTPAKVSFTGKDGTKDPDWGPDSGDTAVKNVYYTHTGSFKQAIAPGKYDVIVSYGPEHDAVFHVDRSAAGRRRGARRRRSSGRSIRPAGSAPTFTAIRAPRATTRRASSAAC